MKRILPVCLLLLAAAAPAAAGNDTIVVRNILAVRLPENSRTHLLPRDPVLAQVVRGSWRAPRAGDRVPVRPDSAAVWCALAADSSGWFRHEALESGWAYAAVTLPAAGVWLLEAGNDEYVFVNGQPRAGNKYRTKDDYADWEPHWDISSLPVALRAGRNDLLFRCERGGLKVELRRPRAPVVLDPRDVTAPDIVADERTYAWAALPVVNATKRTVSNLAVEATVGDAVTYTKLPAVPPLSVRKVPFQFEARPLGPGELTLVVRLCADAGLDSFLIERAEVPLRVVTRGEARRHAFVSKIDGSVQYYAELPSSSEDEWLSRKPCGVVLSLHGANVEALNQVRSYVPRPWTRVIAPTNRRPYGFAWEDWGRLDALEVLDLVIPSDGFPPPVWLTGHSMGGHGTWILGATYPNRFAAIGPSAGWATYWTYRFEYDRAKLSPLQKMLTRASNASETLQLEPNLARLGVYCLQGGADDNVPPAQSHLLVDELKKFHTDWVYHEEPGQGHWWDLSPEPGTDCVDWAPMFEFFARRARMSDKARVEIDFRTASPGVSATCSWVRILGQERQHELSRVHARCLPGSRTVIAETENVTEFALSPAPLGPGADMTVEVDGQTFPADSQRVVFDAPPSIHLERRGGVWSRVPLGRRPDGKSPRRYGPFKDAFRNRFQFVIATRGTAEENAWAAAKARFDAETWLYQGNGAVDIVRDVDFDAKAEPDRGVILYGDARSNGAWRALLPDCPVCVERGAVTVGKRRLAGDDLACLFVRPRAGSEAACVAVVAGTGPAGRRLTDTLPYLQGGFALPDCCVLSSEILNAGDRGIRMAGFFGADWSVDGGEFLWNE